MKVPRPIAVLLVQICLTLAGLELCARVYSLVKFKNIFFINTFYAPPQVTDYAEVNPFLVIQPSTKPPFRDDGFRYRGTDIFLPKAKDEIRIFFLGGSTTANLDLKESFEEVLERDLKPEFPDSQIRCINAAASAYSSNQDLVRFATEVVALEPDVVVLMEAINDIHELFFPSAESRRFIRNGKYFHQRYFPFLNNAVRPKQRWIDRVAYNQALNQSRFLNMLFFRMSTDSASPSRNRVVLSDALIAKGLLEYQSNLLSMKALAASRGARMVFISQPIQLEAFDNGFEQIPYSVNYPSAAQFKDVLQRYSDSMRAAANGCDTCTYIPMSERFEALDHKERYFADLSHFRTEGAVEFARLALPELGRVLRSLLH
jgi:hypothetical protein